MNRSLLVVGHSHTECIRAAVKARPDIKNVRVINIRGIAKEGMTSADIVQSLKTVVKDFNPEALCLVLGGNKHNILGILENPIPFSIGEEFQGVTPSDSSGRHFIPYALMEEMFGLEEFSRKSLAELLYDAFSNTAKMYLNPPPPILDFSHTQQYPGPFRNRLDRGPAPKELRMQLYLIQTNVSRKMAKQNGATFVEPESSLLDAEGFLGPKYYNEDPTHANAAYGQVMLEKLLEIAGQEK